MSLLILKHGLSDTIQDGGRYGHQHLGINPGGVMDRYAMKIANVLVSNEMEEAGLELHFPAAEILFEETVLIALSGADLSPQINERSVPMKHPILVQKGAVLVFKKQITGARVYVSLRGGFQIPLWLQSKSTNNKVKAGGWEGRSLKKNDRIPLQLTTNLIDLPDGTGFLVLPWSAADSTMKKNEQIEFIAGAEYHLLNTVARQKLEQGQFKILPQSDRMGYRLQGDAIILDPKIEMISSAVTRGTIQLLPDGQLIVLMSEHQTTGGYPRIGHVTASSFNSLAQMNAGQKIRFLKTTLEETENEIAATERNLQQLQNACNFRLDQYFYKRRI
jgi:antagonist of KipI